MPRQGVLRGCLKRGQATGLSAWCLTSDLLGWPSSHSRVGWSLCEPALGHVPDRNGL